MTGGDMMNKRKTRNINAPQRLFSTTELSDYLALGRNKSVEVGDKAGARIQVGRRVLWDKQKIDLYIDSAAGR